MLGHVLRQALPAPARRWARRAKALVQGEPGNRPTTADVQGFRLSLPQHFQHHYVQHDYEPLSREFLLAHVPPGGVAVDVGAHIGLYTLLMARAVGETGRVVAVEPAAENLEYLRRNIAANGYDDRVHVVPAAATDRSGTVRFHLTGSSDSHGLHAHPNTPTRRVVELPAVRVDELVEGAAFVKIDTEGAEIGTLDGMTGLLERSEALAALVEWAPRCQDSAGHSLTDLVDAVHAQGFAITVLDDHAGTKRTVADVVGDLRSGVLPPDWYGNLACVRRP